MKPKTKRTVRGLALELIEKIHKQNAYSPLLLNQSIDRHRLEGRDAALLTQLVYGVLQRELTLDFYLRGFLKPNQKLEDWVRDLLYLSIYQMVFLDRIPSHAIVSEAVDLAKYRGHKGIAGFVNGVLRNVIRKGVPSFAELPEEEKWSIEYSHPVWLVKRWIEQFGREEAEAILKANNEPASVSLRINPLKATKEAVLAELEQEGIHAHESEWLPEALLIEKGKVVDQPVFKEGRVSIQDESSMLVAHALDVAPDLIVLDACAGPGGKTAHLAELMEDKGQIIALDLHAHKTKLIDQQADRLGLKSIRTEALDARLAQSAFPAESFDRVLVDAPCTGFGVIRRKPEIKYTKKEQDIKAIAKVQREILDHCAALVKPGGKLVYSTCTIDQEENRDQVLQFLDQHPDYQLDQTLVDRFSFLAKDGETSFKSEGMIQILPSDHDTDGFFIACLVKN